MTVDWAIALAACFAVLAWILGTPLVSARRRRALLARPLTTTQRSALAACFPCPRPLPGDLRDRLERLVSVFIGEKEFVGCGGLALTPQMKVAIAAQACLLVLGRDTHVYDRLRSVLVYPSQFVVSGEWSDEHGIVTRGRRVLAGETWDVSRIVLSWEDVESRREAGGAYNVVIHEFAHYLDHESGGAPWTMGAEMRKRWFCLLDDELCRLRAQVDADERTFLDPYAAEDRSEFFAVASEAFFEQPAAFARRIPALYRALVGVYGLDPASW